MTSISIDFRYQSQEPDRRIKSFNIDDVDWFPKTIYRWTTSGTVDTLSPVQTGATLLANNSQHCWMLHVASVCTTCCMLLDVVACCCAKFETGQTFQPTTPNISFVPWSPKRSATMLDPFAQLFQHCWGHARSLHMVYKDLWVVSFPWCTAGPNIVGSCCVRLHAALALQIW